MSAPLQLPSRLRIRSTLGAGFCLWLAAGAGGAQEPADGVAGFAEEVAVEVVNVDVWVTDRDGSPVTGLSREDFQLFEDGEPVAISHFVAFEAAEPAAAAGRPGEPAPAAVLQGERRLVVFVDDWNLRPADRPRVFQALRRFVREQVGPEVSVMVAYHDGAVRILVPFSRDAAAVSRAFDAVEAAAPAGVHALDRRRTALESVRAAYSRAIDAGQAGGGGTSPASLGGTDPCTAHWGEMVSAGQTYAAETAGHVEGSLSALTTVTDFLAGLPGQKVLLYVGNGMEAQPGAEVYLYLAQLCPSRQSEVVLAAGSHDLTGGFRHLTSRANAHGITVYTLEGEGPGGGLDLSVQGGGSLAPARPEMRRQGPESVDLGGREWEPTPEVMSLSMAEETPETGGATLRPSAELERLRAGNLEGPLFTMAHETGGRALLNLLDFEPELDRLGRELGTYYSLGFAPDHQGDGRAHTLAVKVAGKRYTVRHRTSYRDKPIETRYAERIFAAARMGMEDNPLGVRLELSEVSRPADGAPLSVPLRIWVPLDRLTLLAAPDGTGRVGRLRVMITASDGAGGLMPVRQKLVPVDVGSAEEAPPTDGGAGEKLVEVDLPLPPGRHLVALGVRDEVGGEVSYLRYPFEVDALGAYPLEPEGVER